MSDLVERVEKAIREANDCGVRVDGVIMLCCDERAEGKEGYWPPHNCLCWCAARAAIAIVLEEAAKVVDAMPLSYSAAETAEDCAAAIRKLGEQK